MKKLKIFGENGLFGKTARRSLVIVLAVVAIGAAVYLNYLYFFNEDDTLPPSSDVGNPDTDDGGETDLVSAYFAGVLLSRQEARDEALEVLMAVTESEDALEATKNDALAEISRIALEIEQEANIETLVKAKGFSDCVAVMGDASVSVIVRQDTELLPTQIAQIKEIVYTEAGILPSGVKIIRK